MITKYDVKSFLGSVVGFGKENAPGIMTGVSILLGWGAAYVFWKQGKKAQKAIDIREAELNAEVATGEGVLGAMKAQRELPKQEKISIYLSYCWLALVLGVASTGLAIWGQKINVDRLATAAIATQFFKKRGDDLEEGVKERPGGEKEYREIKREQHRKEFPAEDIMKNVDELPGEGRTICVDIFTGNAWRSDISKLVNGIDKSDTYLHDKYYDKIREKNNSKKKKRGYGAFDVVEEPYSESDSPFPEDGDYVNIYSSLALDDFLFNIGEIKRKNFVRCGEVAEFRYCSSSYKDGKFLKASNILDFEDYIEPSEDEPVLCYVDYTDYLSPTFEFLERNPI